MVYCICMKAVNVNDVLGCVPAWFQLHAVEKHRAEAQRGKHATVEVLASQCVSQIEDSKFGN